VSTKKPDLKKASRRIARLAEWLGCIAAAIALAGGLAIADPERTIWPERLIWFDAPANHFTESVPLGNGRVGAMLFGGIDAEHIILNESGMWSGSPQDSDRPNAAASLPEIRRLLLDGKNLDAERLVNSNFTCAGDGSGFGSGAAKRYGSYQLLAKLSLRFSGNDHTPARNYRRELDLSEAIGRVSYERSGVRFQREAFVSAPDQIFALMLTADKPGSISFDAGLERAERAETHSAGADGLLLSGRLDNGVDGKGVSFAARMRVLNQGGSVNTTENIVQVRGASRVLILVSAATDIKSFAGRKTGDVVKASNQDLIRAAAKPYLALKRAHIADYQSYFNRASLQLGSQDSSASAKPTNARLEAFSRGESDPGLAQLYFDFGRYLLISCSRPGGFPANLQGLWAEEIQNPWNADWHLNINVEMNYWPAEVCNLSELHQPLFALVESMQVPGAQTAKRYYGARGWVAHVITNPWGFTSPGEGAQWGATTTGSAWLCQHLWDHYLFTGDRQFLRWAYPIIKGSAQFYLDMLIEEPRHHWLVTAPSNSPENGFMVGNEQAHICLGATMDMQLLRYLFGACIEASRILGVDPELAGELSEKVKRLAPTRVGSDGRILEWLEEYKEADRHHRHVSHLWGLYPGFEISSRDTPELAAAARKSLDVRGDGGTGWCIGLKLVLWARLGDGNRAYKLLSSQLKPARIVGRITTTDGGTYPNLFDAHPPFQIDGNFGATAGIAEMFLQSRPGEIELLPALPELWRQGYVRGLRARGGFEVSLRWQDGRVTESVIRSDRSTSTNVRLGEKTISLRFRPGQHIRLDADLRSF
jgi:alpha-L-fucosidase 2